MRSTFKILYYINRGKVKADGTTAIMCRITIDGKNSVFAATAIPKTGKPRPERRGMQEQTTFLKNSDPE